MKEERIVDAFCEAVVADAGQLRRDGLVFTREAIESMAKPGWVRVVERDGKIMALAIVRPKQPSKETEKA